MMNLEPESTDNDQIETILEEEDLPKEQPIELEDNYKGENEQREKLVDQPLTTYPTGSQELSHETPVDHTLDTGSNTKLIYVYSTEQIPHLKNHLKVGETTINKKDLEEAQRTDNEDLKTAALGRIRRQSSIFGLETNLEHFESAVKEKNGTLTLFDDHDVHKVLKDSNIKPYRETFGKRLETEWFPTVLKSVKKAIKDVKTDGRGYIDSYDETITLYPHQEDAVQESVKTFEKGGKLMLWNGKPRFGKTIGSYELLKRLGAKKVLIATHRPVVDDSWFKDYKKMGLADEGYKYFSKLRGDKEFEDHPKMIQFASIQDLRGSFDKDTGKLIKNKELFATDWDLVIVDEVHEGTVTKNAVYAFERLKTDKTLHLSGTPYNVLWASDEAFEGSHLFDYDNVFSWEYSDEQEAKKKWDEAAKKWEQERRILEEWINTINVKREERRQEHIKRQEETLQSFQEEITNLQENFSGLLSDEIIAKMREEAEEKVSRILEAMEVEAKAEGLSRVLETNTKEDEFPNWEPLEDKPNYDEITQTVSEQLSEEREDYKPDNPFNTFGKDSLDKPHTEIEQTPNLDEDAPELYVVRDGREVLVTQEIYDSFDWDSPYAYPNPYRESPKMIIMEYGLDELIDKKEVSTKMSDLLATTREPLADSREDELVDVEKTVIKTEDGEDIEKVIKVKELKEPRFVNPLKVKKFIKKLLGDDELREDGTTTKDDRFPFSDEYSEKFKHTFWLLPNVDAVIAMENLLVSSSSGYGGWTIINATGKGDIATGEKALKRVQTEIAKEKDVQGKNIHRTITLSQEMLTTGVTVPEWTAVFQMNDSKSAIQWMQSSFRASTPHIFNDGVIKEQFYVFDFNPERLYGVISEIHKAGEERGKGPGEGKDGKTSTTLFDHYALGRGGFVQRTYEDIVEKINLPTGLEVMHSGFSSYKLFDEEALLSFPYSLPKFFNALGKILEESEDGVPSLTKIDRKAKSRQEYDEKRDYIDYIQSKNMTTDDEMEEYERAIQYCRQEEYDYGNNRENIRTILSKVSSKIPSMLFTEPIKTTGGKIADSVITTYNFNSFVSKDSWKEFMPEGLGQVLPKGAPTLYERLYPKKAEESMSLESVENIEEIENKGVEEKTGVVGEELEKPKTEYRFYWADLIRFFNNDVFKSASRSLREAVIMANNASPLLSVVLFREILETFVNPDKETVLTPSRVVDLQLGSTVGGLVFTDLESSTGRDTNILVRNLFTGKRKSIPLKGFGEAIGESLVLAPTWVTSGGEELELVGSDGRLVPSTVERIVSDPFWANPDFTGFDPNSKTGLYPQYLALSRFVVRVLKEGLNPFLFVPCNEVEEDELSRLREVWMEVVRGEIFANSRVPAARRFTEQLLLPLGTGVDNYTVFDLPAFQNIWEWFGRRDTALIDAAKVLQLLNQGYLESLSSKGKIMFPVGISEKVTGLLGYLDKMTVGGTVNREELGEEFLKVLDDKFSELSMIVDGFEVEEFSVVVGNPPYQVQTGGKSHQVYPLFYFLSTMLGKKVSMVFLSGWQYSTGRASGSSLHPKMREDRSLVSVDNYLEESDSPITLFPDASTGGVSVILWDKDYDSEETLVMEHGENPVKRDLTVIKYWSETTDEIFQKLQGWMKENGIEGMNKVVSGRNPFGALTYYLDPSRKEWGRISDTEGKNTIPLYGSKRGEAGYRFFHIPKDFTNVKGAPLKLVNADKWKAIWMKSGAYANWRQALVLPPGKITTDTFIGVFFDTEVEAENFITYLRTYLYRFLISEQASDHNAYSVVHVNVPNLSTITNPRTGKIGWESDWTDEDLTTLFKDLLSEEDWEYIEKTAIESDPAGERMKAQEQEEQE